MERFETRDSRLAIVRRESGLYLNLVNTGMPELERPELMRLTLCVDNKAFSRPEWSVSDGVLTLGTALGSVEFAFKRGDVLCVRGESRVCAQFSVAEPRQFENACAREDGAVEAAFNVVGKLLFAPVKGALYHDAMWIPAQARTGAYKIVLLPSVESRGFAAEIYAYHSNGVAD